MLREVNVKQDTFSQRKFYISTTKRRSAVCSTQNSQWISILDIVSTLEGLFLFLPLAFVCPFSTHSLCLCLLQSCWQRATLILKIYPKFIYVLFFAADKVSFFMIFLFCILFLLFQLLYLIIFEIIAFHFRNMETLKSIAKTISWTTQKLLFTIVATRRHTNAHENTHTSINKHTLK